jgi:pyruvate/2-oxoglutarate/acetoin dehydrogenase E1 component
LLDFDQKLAEEKREYYNKFLFSDSKHSPLLEKGVPAQYSESSPLMMGYEVVNHAFDKILERDPRVIAFGEDVGNLGDVNQGFRGLQTKYGIERVTDTGIREATIIGQGIGMAMRGLRPIAEIQYLDYLLYALQIMADDLSNLRWRTAGRQQAPLIIRTRGHRLEGIFHSGSPMAGIINLIRGIHVLVPRNMTQAAGFYNTLIEGDDPALVVEVLNGYRLKERLPDNIAQFKLRLGVPEVLIEGEDITIVTYGATVRIAEAAVKQLAKAGIRAELIDVQSLLPFDRDHHILDSIKKTSRVLFVDEDVPGGTSAYMLQQVVEGQGAWKYLDSAPQTLSGSVHRPAYGSDGDYYSKPNAETIFDKVYAIMRESNPSRFPLIRSGE